MKHTKVEIKVSNQKNLGSHVESLKLDIPAQDQPSPQAREAINNFQSSDVLPKKYPQNQSTDLAYVTTPP